MTRYRFPRRPERCAICERPFEPGEELVSCICPAPEEEGVEEQEGDGAQEPVLPFLRLDHCIACAPDPLPPEVYSHWRTRMPAARPRPPGRIDAALILEFFQRVAAREDPATAGHLYFLALYLMRRRVLKFIDTEHRDDQEVWILESRPAGQRYEVVDPGLGPEELEGVREHIMDALSAGDMEL
jgi:hypothetical protein